MVRRHRRRHRDQHDDGGGGGGGGVGGGGGGDEYDGWNIYGIQFSNGISSKLLFIFLTYLELTSTHLLELIPSTL